MAVNRYPAFKTSGRPDSQRGVSSDSGTDLLREQNARLQRDLTRALEERNRLLKKLNQPSGVGRRAGGSRILEARLDETREELTRQVHEREAAEKRLRFLEEELARLAKVPGEFLQRLLGIEGLLEGARGADAGVTGGDERLERTIDRFNAAVESIWDKLDRHEIVENRHLREKVAKLSHTLEENRTDRERLQAELESHRDTIEELGRVAGRLEAERSINSSEIERLRDRLAKLKEENAQIGESNLKLKSQLGDLKVRPDSGMFTFTAGSDPLRVEHRGVSAWVRSKQAYAGLALGLVIAITGQWLYATFLASSPTQAGGPWFRFDTASTGAPTMAPAITPAAGKTPAGRPSSTAAAVANRDGIRSGGQGPLLVELAGGAFTMGTNRYGTPEIEHPAREITVRPFLMGRYEVTFQEYDVFARATGRRLPDDQGWGRGNRPVVNVTWQDARDYAAWLSEQTGRSYRLPTEAEWEYAMGGGSKALYWWGKDFERGREVCFNCGTSWDNLSTAPVGSTAANPFGLYDMGGNVMEWVSDCSTDDAEPCTARVVRGSSFNRPDDALRITARRYLPAAISYSMVGFRIVREP